MKLWTLTYNENIKENFPQIRYKGNRIITSTEQATLTNKLFGIIQLTNRDNLKEIRMVIDEFDELPFKALYNIIFNDQDPNFEFQTEYMVEMLNLFQVELEYLR